MPSLKMIKSIKLSKEFLFVVFAFIAVILYSNYGSCCGGVRPHNPRTLGLGHSKFEAFTTDETTTEEEKTDAEKTEEKKALPTLFQSMMGALPGKGEVDATKVEEGFTSLSPMSVNASAKVDPYGASATTTKNPEEFNQSAGYSKSTGRLKWSPEALALFGNRGNNASA